MHSFFCKFINLLRKYLLSANYMPGKTVIELLLWNLMGEGKNEHKSMYKYKLWS